MQGLQLILVVLVMAFPQQVTMFLDKPQVVDMSKVKIELNGDGKAEDADKNEDLMQDLGAKK